MIEEELIYEVLPDDKRFPLMSTITFKNLDDIDNLFDEIKVRLESFLLSYYNEYNE